MKKKLRRHFDKQALKNNIKIKNLGNLLDKITEITYKLLLAAGYADKDDYTEDEIKSMVHEIGDCVFNEAMASDNL